MASVDDVNSNLRGIAQNLAQMVQVFGSPGRTAQTTVSPVPTATTVGNSVLQVVAFNAQRRAISFHNSNPIGTTIWVIPNTSLAPALNGPGIPIVPGGDYVVDIFLGSNCSWNAIAGANATLTILEFV